MTEMPRRVAEEILKTYFLAKDGNRPHLLRGVFSERAVLEVIVHAGAISFPPICEGREQIAEVLVRRFCQSFDNVYSFYLDRPPTDSAADDLHCRWLVAMTEKAGGAPRVGCGTYDWRLSRASGLADSLVITIDAMEALPTSAAEPVLEWARRLPYPWCPARTAVEAAPSLSELQPILDSIRRGEPVAR